MAIETARLSLHETVTPEIEKLLSQKLNEDLNEADEEEDEKEGDEHITKSKKAQKKDPMDEISKLGLDETTLAAISKALGEAEEDESAGPIQSKHMVGDKEEDQDEDESYEQDEALDLETALAEIEAKSGEDDEEGESEEESEEGEDEEKMDESLDIDAILAEMDNEEEGEDEEQEEEDESALMEEYGDDTYEAGKDAEKGKVQKGGTNDKGLFTKNHIVVLKDLMDRIAHYEAGKGAEKGKEVKGKMKTPLPTGSKVIAQTQLQEAQISQLRTELKELNLLTAKNLYLNKVLVLPNLTESNKAKAITAFDKVKTVGEAKAVFEALTTALKPATKAKKSTIAESLGFGKLGQFTPEQKAEKTDFLPVANEWQRRAGIKLN